MPGSIEMPDIVNTLMLCDLTFNSFRAVHTRRFMYVFIHIVTMARWLDVGGLVLMKVDPLVVTVGLDVHPLVLFALTQQAKFIAKFLHCSHRIFSTCPGCYLTRSATKD